MSRLKSTRGGASAAVATFVSPINEVARNVPNRRIVAPRSCRCETRLRTKLSGETRESQARSPSGAGQQLSDRILDLLHLDRLAEHDQPVVGRQPFAEAPLFRAQQDKRGQGLANFVRFLVHVEECVDRLMTEAVKVEDHDV